MKKLILYFILFLSTCVNASQTIPIVWAFSPASNQANALRLIIDNANKAQSKYTFIFENKPGAGGSIAVNHVINSATPTLLMMSTSIFVRPFYYPEQSYDIGKLQPIAITATGSPLAILSTQFSNIDELVKKPYAKIGVVQGSITESVARAIQKNSMILVPYQSSINATNDLLGGHIDASVEFIKDSIPWSESGKAKIIGITGANLIGEYKNIKNAEHLISNYYMVTNKNINDFLVRELHDIITKAMLQQNVIELWKGDYAIVTNRSLIDTVYFWETQKKHWEIK